MQTLSFWEIPELILGLYDLRLWSHWEDTEDA